MTLTVFASPPLMLSYFRRSSVIKVASWSIEYIRKLWNYFLLCPWLRLLLLVHFLFCLRIYAVDSGFEFPPFLFPFSPLSSSRLKCLGEDPIHLSCLMLSDRILPTPPTSHVFPLSCCRILLWRDWEGNSSAQRMPPNGCWSWRKGLKAPWSY